MPPARNTSASVRRALTILLHLGQAADGASAAEIAAELSIDRSTAQRLLRPLCDARLAARDATTGRYRLGWRTATLGQAYLDRLDLRGAAHGTLQRLTADSGETTHLVLADLPGVVYVDKVDSPQPVRMHSRIGHREPAYCTAVGKAILAAGPADGIVRVVAAGLPARTDRTITDGAALRADLADVARRGYAIDDVENEPGVRCVAAAIVDLAGDCVAAISISAPADRFDMDAAAVWGPRVAAAAATISRLLGAQK